MLIALVKNVYRVVGGVVVGCQGNWCEFRVRKKGSGGYPKGSIQGLEQELRWGHIYMSVIARTSRSLYQFSILMIRDKISSRSA